MNVLITLLLLYLVNSLVHWSSVQQVELAKCKYVVSEHKQTWWRGIVMLDYYKFIKC